MEQTKNLTNPFDKEMSFKIARTPKGMAHWSGTGPRGRACYECLKGFDFKRRSKTSKKSPGRLFAMRCNKFADLMGKEGPRFDPATLGCRFFEQAETYMPLIETEFKS